MFVHTTLPDFAGLEVTSISHINLEQEFLFGTVEGQLQGQHSIGAASLWIADDLWKSRSSVGFKSAALMNVFVHCTDRNLIRFGLRFKMEFFGLMCSC